MSTHTSTFHEIAVLIPALNCDATIGGLVAGARQYVPEVLDRKSVV